MNVEDVEAGSDRRYNELNIVKENQDGESEFANLDP